MTGLSSGAGDSLNAFPDRGKDCHSTGRYRRGSLHKCLVQSMHCLHQKTETKPEREERVREIPSATLIDEEMCFY